MFVVEIAINEAKSSEIETAEFDKPAISPNIDTCSNRENTDSPTETLLTFEKMLTAQSHRRADAPSSPSRYIGISADSYFP
jgi:hypothetical protein